MTNLKWSRHKAFNPGYTYVALEEDGSLIWIISQTPDGAMWQLGGNKSTTGYGAPSTHATANQAMKIATAWSKVLELEQGKDQ